MLLLICLLRYLLKIIEFKKTDILQTYFLFFQVLMTVIYFFCNVVKKMSNDPKI